MDATVSPRKASSDVSLCVDPPAVDVAIGEKPQPSIAKRIELLNATRDNEENYFSRYR
jgi:hypothetical protein